MRIERVDDKTVKCFISNEELEEYDIDYKDFIMRSDKAKEVVQEIIEQAAEAVDSVKEKAEEVKDKARKRMKKPGETA